MSKKIQDSVLFAVMTILIFTVFTLSQTSLNGSGGGGIRYLHLHWIVFREDLAQDLTLVHVYTGRLLALIAVSLCLTWLLSRVLKLLHEKKSRVGWLLFIFVMLISLGYACVQNFAFS